MISTRSHTRQPPQGGWRGSPPQGLAQKLSPGNQASRRRRSGEAERHRGARLKRAPARCQARWKSSSARRTRCRDQIAQAERRHLRARPRGRGRSRRAEKILTESVQGSRHSLIAQGIAGLRRIELTNHPLCTVRIRPRSVSLLHTRGTCAAARRARQREQNASAARAADRATCRWRRRRMTRIASPDRRCRHLGLVSIAYGGILRRLLRHGSRRLDATAL